MRAVLRTDNIYVFTSNKWDSVFLRKLWRESHSLRDIISARGPFLGTVAGQGLSEKMNSMGG